MHADERITATFPHLYRDQQVALLARELDVKPRDVRRRAESLGLVMAGETDTQVRRRRARAGDWTERELADASIEFTRTHDVEAAAALVGRHPDEVRLRLSQAGVTRVIEEHDATDLRSAARRLRCAPEVLLTAVLRGELAACAPDESGTAGIPDLDWQVTSAQLGAFIVAHPDHEALLDTEASAIILAVFKAGITCGKAIHEMNEVVEQAFRPAAA